MKHSTLTLFLAVSVVFSAFSTDAFAADSKSTSERAHDDARDCQFQRFDSAEDAETYLRQHGVKSSDNLIGANTFDSTGGHAILQCTGADQKKHLMKTDGSEGPVSPLPSSDLSTTRPISNLERGALPPGVFQLL